MSILDCTGGNKLSACFSGALSSESLALNYLKHISTTHVFRSGKLNTMQNSAILQKHSTDFILECSKMEYLMETYFIST